MTRGFGPGQAAFSAPPVTPLSRAGVRPLLGLADVPGVSCLLAGVARDSGGLDLAVRLAVAVAAAAGALPHDPVWDDKPASAPLLPRLL